jgi:hypothetical protein
LNECTNNNCLIILRTRQRKVKRNGEEDEESGLEKEKDQRKGAEMKGGKEYGMRKGE